MIHLSLQSTSIRSLVVVVGLKDEEVKFSFESFQSTCVFEGFERRRAAEVGVGGGVVVVSCGGGGVGGELFSLGKRR